MKKLIAWIKLVVKNIKTSASVLWFRDFDLKEYE